MPIFRSDFDIHVSDSKVWDILTDFEKYTEWNPSLPFISGELKEGSVVSLRLGFPGKKPMDVTARLEHVIPNKKLTWRGKVGASWLFSGYRIFEINVLEQGKIKFTHVEDISGLLAPVFKIFMGNAVQQSHNDFNEALRKRAEELAE